MTWRTLVGVAALTVAGAIGMDSAYAVWSAGGTGSAGSTAYVMPTGAAPSTSRSGSNITVSWSAARFPGGPAVAGYIVRRYNASTDASATVGSSCSGIVTSTSCIESSVPSGTWVYTDTPVQSNWSGGESPDSTAVTVP